MEAQIPVEIRRTNRLRTMTVTAYQVGRSLGDIAADIRAGLQRLKLPEGVTVELGRVGAEGDPDEMTLALLASRS